MTSFARNAGLTLLLLTACSSAAPADAPAEAPPPTSDERPGMGDAGKELDEPVVPDPATGDASTARCDPAKPFGEPMKVEGLPSDASHPYLSADELTIYFDKSRDLYTATRPDRTSPFSSAQPLEELNTPKGHEYRPSVSPDGLTIYFMGDISGGVFTATRPTTSANFGARQPVPGMESQVAATPQIQTHDAFLDPSGKVLIAYRIEDNSKGLVWSIDGSPRTPVPIDACKQGSCAAPVLSADRLVLIWSDNNGKFFIATRKSLDAPFGPASPLDIKTGQFDVPGWLSPDGCALYFSETFGGRTRVVFRGM